MVTTEVEICNLALQRLGAGSIASLTEDSREAEVCSVVYAQARDSLLQEHPWNFAVRRAVLVGTETVEGSWHSSVMTASADWDCVCFSDERFIALSRNASAQSVNGIVWTALDISGLSNRGGNSVVHGNGKTVTVGDGDAYTVTSGYLPDGDTIWTSAVSTPNTNRYQSVCYSDILGLYVAVSSTGTGNRVMTSSDGTSWTARTSASDNDWQSVCVGYDGLGVLFVAVANSGTGNRVMTSLDGITWTSRTTPADLGWREVCFGNGIFVAVADSGTGNRVMTSLDGITWTSRTTPADLGWRSVVWSGSEFIAVAAYGGEYRSMSSPDGISWGLQTGIPIKEWRSIAVGVDKVVSVAADSNNIIAYKPFSETTTLPAPAFGLAYAYALPSNFLRLLTYEQSKSYSFLPWQIEGGYLLTDDGEAPQIRYITRVTDPASMPPLFVDALAMRLAALTCETLTQSNTKLATILADEKRALNLAKRVDAQENPAEELEQGSWFRARSA